jgi:hypothetical protein
MRLATVRDELVPTSDDRVKADPTYLAVDSWPG